MELIQEFYLCLFMLYAYCTVTVNCNEYIGCFEYQSDDELDNGINHLANMKHNNRHSCVKRCYPYFLYASTEGTQCFCTNDLIGQLVGDKWCDTPCPGRQEDGNNSPCGGTFRMSVYDLHPNRARGDIMEPELIYDFPGTSRGNREIVTVEKTSTAVTVCAIGTFAVLCMSMIVKLILFMKKIRSNIGKNKRVEDGYIRPIYSSTTRITKHGQSQTSADSVQTRPHIYESVDNAKMDD